MKYGVFADVHGNLEAAETVIDYFKGRVDSLIFVGDVVGYGANPNECIELIKKSSAIVAGNHDWASVDLMNIDYFNPYAKKAILWTRKELSSSGKNFLKDLDLTFSNGDFSMVHGSLDEPKEFKYIFDAQGAVKTMEICDTQVCFVAHSHTPMYFSKEKFSNGKPNREIIKKNSQDINLEQERDYLFNVGSVGQPRDGNPYACCVIYDSDARKLHYQRIQYPIKVAQKKIEEAGLPQILSSRLERGY